MRRRAACLLGLLLLTACGAADPVRLEGKALPAAVLAFVAAQQDDGRSEYEPPSDQARADLAAAVVALGGGDRAKAQRLAAAHAYTVLPLDGGALALAPGELPDDRGWGLYVVQPEGRELAVEVPHPRADLDTERIGAALAVDAGARYLLVAGARRDAADDRADVARAADSVFSGVHAALAEQDVPALQLHGYAEDSLPGVDVVVSPGAAEVSELARRVAAEAQEAGLEVCRAWERTCGRLEGRRNVQGRASREAGTPFVHLELSRPLREDGARDALVDLLVRAV